MEVSVARVVLVSVVAAVVVAYMAGFLILAVDDIRVLVVVPAIFYSGFAIGRELGTLETAEACEEWCEEVHRDGQG